MSLHWIDVVVVVVYMTGMVALGLRFARRQTSTETYFVAKRSIPAWAVGMSLLATIISAITFGITLSRHLIKADELATADPAQVIRLLRPCVLSLAARPDTAGSL